MLKAKVLFGSMMLVAIFATMSTSALAQWESASLTGEAQIKSPLRTDQLLWKGGSGGSVKCLGVLDKAEGGKASWESNALKGATEVKLTSESKDWTGCEATAGTTKESPATVTCAQLVLKQPSKEGEAEGKAVGSSGVECTVKTANCLIALPAQTATNPVSLVKSGSNQNDSGEIGPLKGKASGLCSLVLGTSTTNSELLIAKTEPLILLGIKLI